MVGNELELITRLNYMKQLADDLSLQAIEAEGRRLDNLMLQLDIVEDEIDEIEGMLG